MTLRLLPPDREFDIDVPLDVPGAEAPVNCWIRVVLLPTDESTASALSCRATGRGAAVRCLLGAVARPLHRPPGWARLRRLPGGGQGQGIGWRVEFGRLRAMEPAALEAIEGGDVGEGVTGQRGMKSAASFTAAMTPQPATPAAAKASSAQGDHAHNAQTTRPLTAMRGKFRMSSSMR